MKWFRRFFGTPTRDELAQLMIDAHRRAGVEGAIEYEAESFRLQIATASGKPILQNLHNTLTAYSAARPWQRGKVLRQYSSAPWDIPAAATWEEAAPLLLPGIRDAYMLETMRLQARLEGESGDIPYLSRSFAGRLVTTLLEDHQQHMKSVNPESLETWGVSFDEALATALSNLEAGSMPRRWANPYAGVYISDWNDDYDASRILLGDILAGLDLRGVPVALVPNRNTLIVTGSEDDEAVEHALLLAEAQPPAPGTLSVLPLRQTPSGWDVWEIGENHPSRETFRRLRLEEVGGIYTDQKQMLDAIHEKEQIDIYVASFSAFTDKETGLVRSYSTWSQDVLTLLPRTDLIGFYDSRLPEQQRLRGLFEWEKVKAVCGHLMQKTEDIPPRYRIEQFPTEEDFHALGAPAA